MQKQYVYIFILLYLVAMLRPVAPFVEYVINYDYISKVLCINKDKPELQCNGKCQLMLKIKEQQNNDFNSLRINMEEYPIGFVELIDISAKKAIKIYKINKFSYNKIYSYLFEKATFHPPNSSFLYRLA